MRNSIQMLPLIALLALTTSRPVVAGVDVTLWNLSTLTLDQSGDLPVSNRFDITTITNPLLQNTQSHVGLNSAQVNYDYSWLTSSLSGSFHTTLAQTFRSRDVHQVSSGYVRFQTTDSSFIHANSIMNYSHTPGDDDLVFWTFSMHDVSANQLVFSHQEFGGNGLSRPSSGQFVVDETHELLAGHLYQINYQLDCDNLSDTLPTGTMDISGFVHWTITPEPTSLVLMMLGLPILLCRQRRNWMDANCGLGTDNTGGFHQS